VEDGRQEAIDKPLQTQNSKLIERQLGFDLDHLQDPDWQSKYLRLLWETGDISKHKSIL